MSRAFIPDGYTVDCFFKAVPNIYEDVRFKYRPVLPESTRALMHNYHRKTAKQQGQIVDETLSRQIVEWDIRDPEGNPVEVTRENMRHITTTLKDRFFNVVTCYEGGDTDETEETTDDDDKINFDELLTGESSGAKDAAAESAKN